MEVWFNYSASCDTLEKQANEQGFTLGENVEKLQKLNDSIIMCWIHGICTDSQRDSMVKKLQKEIIKSLKRKEGDI